MGKPPLNAFIDEAGQRGTSKKSSDHFVMSAVIVADEHLPATLQLLADLRTTLGRKPEDVLHFQKFRHPHRIRACQILAAHHPAATIASVVVCKRHLTDTARLNDDQAYLYTFRYLLERLSWFAQTEGRVMHYTLAHVVRFKMKTLRQYEAALHSRDTQIKWAFLDPKGGRLAQPENLEMLQLADTVASATGLAFNPDNFGNTEPRYLQELAPAMYRRGTAPNALTSYGLKMHPWNETTKATYPWVAAL